MLFCYPLLATEENWLHESIADLVIKILTETDYRLEDEWLESFPAGKRTEVARKKSLLTRLKKFSTEARRIDHAKKAAVLRCMESQNAIPELFDAVTTSHALPPDLRPEVIQAIDDLFKIAFRLLSNLGIRDRQYEKAYESIPAHVCAFCGIEPLDSPVADIPRENLDHYLAFSLYPFAGANLRNLAPMGHKCNSSHKGATNVLVNKDGVRRRCFDPYGDLVAKVSLLDSRPFGGPTKDLFVLPAWQIDLVGAHEETLTWDSVFSIRTRYRTNVLDAEIRSWMDHFAQWWAQEAGCIPTNVGTVVTLLERYLEAVIQEGFADHTFLKRATFEMFAHQCSQPASGQRLVDWIISLLSPDTGAVLPVTAP
jgi:hypothetical protein